MSICKYTLFIFILVNVSSCVQQSSIDDSLNSVAKDQPEKKVSSQDKHPNHISLSFDSNSNQEAEIFLLNDLILNATSDNELLMYLKLRKKKIILYLSSYPNQSIEKFQLSSSVEIPKNLQDYVESKIRVSGFLNALYSDYSNHTNKIDFSLFLDSGAIKLIAPETLLKFAGMDITLEAYRLGEVYISHLLPLSPDLKSVEKLQQQSFKNKVNRALFVRIRYKDSKDEHWLSDITFNKLLNDVNNYFAEVSNNLFQLRTPFEVITVNVPINFSEGWCTRNLTATCFGNYGTEPGFTPHYYLDEAICQVFPNINLVNYDHIIFFEEESEERHEKMTPNLLGSATMGPGFVKVRIKNCSGEKVNIQTRLIGIKHRTGNIYKPGYLGEPHQSLINLAHELGHNLGWEHARFKPLETDYGNPFDVMGNHFFSFHPSAYYKFFKGWLPINDVIFLSGMSQKNITLKPSELTSGKRMVSIIVDDSKFFLEFKQPLGFDRTLAHQEINGLSDGLLISQEYTRTTKGSNGTILLPPTDNFSGSFHLSALREGMCFIDESERFAVYVHVDGIRGDDYESKTITFDVLFPELGEAFRPCSDSPSVPDADEPEKFSDLVVTSFVFEESTIPKDAEVKAFITIQNIGDVRSQEVFGVFSKDYKAQPQVFRLPPLEPNESYNFEEKIIFTQIGERELKLFIDWANEEWEKDELNNLKSANISVINNKQYFEYFAIAKHEDARGKIYISFYDEESGQNIEKSHQTHDNDGLNYLEILDKTDVFVYAQPDKGSELKELSGCDTYMDENRCVVTIDVSKPFGQSVSAKFEPIKEYRLSVSAQTSDTLGMFLLKYTEPNGTTNILECDSRKDCWKIERLLPKGTTFQVTGVSLLAEIAFSGDCQQNDPGAIICRGLKPLEEDSQVILNYSNQNPPSPLVLTIDSHCSLSEWDCGDGALQVYDFGAEFTLKGRECYVWDFEGDCPYTFTIPDNSRKLRVKVIPYPGSVVNRIICSEYGNVVSCQCHEGFPGEFHCRVPNRATNYKVNAQFALCPFLRCDNFIGASTSNYDLSVESMNYFPKQIVVGKPLGFVVSIKNNGDTPPPETIGYLRVYQLNDENNWEEIYKTLHFLSGLPVNESYNYIIDPKKFSSASFLPLSVGPYKFEYCINENDHFPEVNKNDNCITKITGQNKQFLKVNILGKGRVNSYSTPFQYNLNCSPLCHIGFDTNSRVDLYPQPLYNHNFVKWLGDDAQNCQTISSHPSSCRLTMDQSRNISAMFVKKGDLDNDGKILASDAFIALKIALGIEIPNLDLEIAKAAAKVDEDNLITATDALIILNMAVGININKISLNYLNFNIESVGPGKIDLRFDTEDNENGITLIARPDEGEKFAQWEGACENTTSLECFITKGRLGTIKAIFEKVQPLACPVIPKNGCLKAEKASLQFALGIRPSIRWTYSGGNSIQRHELGEIDKAISYSACIYQEDSLIYNAVLPKNAMCGRRECWKTSSNTSISFKDKESSHNGLNSLSIKSGSRPSAKFSFQGGSFSMEQLPAKVETTIQVINDKGTCLETTFKDSDISIKENLNFKAKYRRKI